MIQCSMSWLVAHGGSLEWAALVPFLVCGWAAPVVWLRWRAFRARCDLRATFEQAADGPFEDGRVVTLKGQLEQRGAACARFEDGSTAAVSSVRTLKLAAVVSAEHLVLRGAQTVTLAGPFEVLVGSRVSARGQPLGKLRLAAVQRVSQALAVEPNQSVWFQSLSDRDALWVRGRLVCTSSEIGDSARWRLVPETDRIPLLYCGWPHVTAGGWWRSPLATMVAIVLYFALAKLAYVSGAYALAAATPYRNTALQRLRDRLSVAAERDPKAIDALELVQGVRGDYCHLLSRLRELGHLDRAARAATRCDEPAERDALALCFLRRGRFTDASAVLEKLPARRGVLYPGVDLAINVHLLAGQPRRALSRLEYLSQLTPVGGIPVETANETKARVHCLQLALRAKLDRDPAALDALRKRSAAPIAQYACTVLYAELVQGDERLRALESCVACRSKHARLTLPWLLGVEPACPRGQEESTRCTDWLLEAKSALRHAQWDHTQPLPWVLCAMPGVESNVNRYLVESSKRTERITDTWNWTRDRLAVFDAVTWPSAMYPVEPLLDELAKARDSGQPLAQSSRDQLRTLLARAAFERPGSAEASPALRKIAWEQGTCYRPRGWYDRELDPRRTLANLLWTAQSLDTGAQPELVAELWITARAFTSALRQPDTMVALMALHQ